jgi:hypothetical protein
MITEPSADSEVAKLIAATAKPVKVSKTVLGERPDDADDDTTYFRLVVHPRKRTEYVFGGFDECGRPITRESEPSETPRTIRVVRPEPEPAPTIRIADWLSVAPSTEEAPPLAPGEGAGCTVLPGNRNAA